MIEKNNFTSWKDSNVYVVYEINLRVNDLDSKFTLLNSLFDAVKLTKNLDSDKYSYSGYGIGFYARETFSLSDCRGFVKNVTIFRVDNSSSGHADN